MNNTRAFSVAAVAMSVTLGFFIGGGPSVMQRGTNGAGGEVRTEPAPVNTSLFAAAARTVTTTRTATPFREPRRTPAAEQEVVATHTSEPTRTPRLTRTPGSTQVADVTEEATSTLPTTTGPTETSAPAPVAITIGAGVNLRQGPSLDATILRALYASTNAEAVARSSDGQWLQVQIPDEPETVWVFAQLVQPGGDLGTLPVGN